MRTITAAQQAVLSSGASAEYVRVQVKDSGGTFRDLSTYPGFNCIKSVKWTESIDNPHATFDISLFREQYQLSLSPYVQASAVNRAFAYPGSFAALLALNRELKIEVAIVAQDTQPGAGDWFEVLRGNIETIDAAQDQAIQLTGTSTSGRLSKQFIKTELVYSFAATGGLAVPLRVWEPGIAVTVSPLVYCLPASRGDGGSGGTPDPGFNKFVKCSQAGTTGLTEPVWTTGAGQVDGTAKWDYVGAPTTSGNNVEQIMQNIMTDNLGTGDTLLTLNTPVSPGWLITQFIQQREFTMDAIKALATQIGWDVRMKWDSGSSTWKLTLYQPTRVAPSVNFTFAKNEYRTPTQLKIDVSMIRNHIRVIYPDPADTWPDGTPKRKIIEVSDSGSITKYGELWCEIQEDQTSNIDTAAEATTFANACLSDCKEPTADMSIPLVRGFPWAELNDYYTFSQNGLQFDTDQSLAVVQYSHASEAGKGVRTSLQVRGLPTIGAKSYLGMSVHNKLPGKFRPHQMVPFNGVKTPSAQLTDIVGGKQLTLPQTIEKNSLPEEYEHHVYTTPGATLSAATLVAVTKDRVVTVPNLIPTKQYYQKVVPRFKNADRVIRGQPSVEVPFFPGQASALHLQQAMLLGDYPLNGGFETKLDAGASLPDWWQRYPGSGGSFSTQTANDGVSGANYVRLSGTFGNYPAIISALMPLINEAGAAAATDRYGGMYRVRGWVRNAAGNAGGSVSFGIIGYDYLGTTPGTTYSVNLDCTSHAGKWQFVDLTFELNTGFAGAGNGQFNALFYIAITGGGAITSDIDELRIQYLGSPWYKVGDTTKFTDTYQAIPGFTNLWVADVTDPYFRRTVDGYVELKGSVKTGTIGAAAFTLPTSPSPPYGTFRPQTLKRFCQVTGFGAMAEVQVTTGGAVIVASGGANAQAWTSLDGIRFQTNP